MIKSGFFNSLNGDRKYNADHFGYLIDAMISNGVFMTYGSAMFVVPDPTTLGVNISDGQCWYDGIFTRVMGSEPIPLEQNNTSNDREDYIYIVIDKRISARCCYFEVSHSPITSHLENVYYHLFAKVNVRPGVSTIAQSDITQEYSHVMGIAADVGDLEQRFSSVRSYLDSAGSVWFSQFESEFDQLMSDLQSTLDSTISQNIEEQLSSLETQISQNAIEQVNQNITQEINQQIEEYLTENPQQNQNDGIFSVGLNGKVQVTYQAS